MNVETNGHPTVIRTGRGLTIAGTRITLYQILDLLKVGQPQEIVRDRFRLTVKQMQDVIQYIEHNQDEVESEYRDVVEQAEENRRYWEKRNRERFAQINEQAPKPENAEMWHRLQA